MGVSCGFLRGRVGRNCRGTTLIEALVFLFVFSIITVTFYSTWSLGMQYINLSKNRLVASALATEKMEVIRNLAFEDIAHTTGFPVGNLLQDEDVIRSGGTYHVHTQIVNRDDDFDGMLGGSPNDANFIDYKDVKISVSFGSGGQTVSLLSRFVPAGIEQSAAGLGVLVINVMSDKDGGALVSGASVRVQNTGIGYDETNTTDGMGRLMLVGVPEAIKEYVITVSKGGYETVATLPPYPATAYNPTHEYASVVELAVNTANIYSNPLAELSMETNGGSGADAPNVGFRLKGGRVLGTDAVDPTIKTHNTDATDSTDGSGERDYGDVSPGSYFFTLDEPNTTLVGFGRTATHLPSPDEKTWEFSIAPGESAAVSARVAPDATTGALFKIEKDTDNTPIAGASVHFVNAGIPFDDTIVADAIGYAFFPDDSTPLAAGVYDYTVSATGFVDATGQVTVSGGAIETETVIMTAS